MVGIHPHWSKRFNDILYGPEKYRKERLHLLLKDFDMYYEDKKITPEAIEFYSDINKELIK